MRSHIQPGMRVLHRLTGQEGNVLELDKIGYDPGALVQWVDSRGRRDGEPTWTLAKNLDRAGDLTGRVAR